MRLTNDQIYEFLLDEWGRTKNRMYDTDDLDEMREYMDYLEVLDNLMFKYEEGIVQKSISEFHKFFIHKITL